MIHTIAACVLACVTSSHPIPTYEEAELVRNYELSMVDIRRTARNYDYVWKNLHRIPARELERAVNSYSDAIDTCQAIKAEIELRFPGRWELKPCEVGIGGY